jgi:hypothetical protein
MLPWPWHLQLHSPARRVVVSQVWRRRQRSCCRLRVLFNGLVVCMEGRLHHRHSLRGLSGSLQWTHTLSLARADRCGRSNARPPTLNSPSLPFIPLSHSYTKHTCMNEYDRILRLESQWFKLCRVGGGAGSTAQCKCSAAHDPAQAAPRVEASCAMGLRACGWGSDELASRAGARGSLTPWTP